MRKTYALLLLVCAITAKSQTTIDLGTQARNVDFSNAISTRPIKVGASLPAVCKTGDLFFRVGISVTEVIYACTANNIWSQQSGATGIVVNGTGLVAQTPAGTITRSLTAGNGLVLLNADAQAGNPTVAADTASQIEAEAGNAPAKLMTPERTRQAFQVWNPIPNQVANEKGFLTTDGSALRWTWKLITPPSGTQNLSGSMSGINADRLFVAINPTSTVTLSAAPVIADGEDGQFVTITNVSTANSITFGDEANMAGSNLRLGGSGMTLAPRESATFVFAATIGDWVLTHKASSGAGGVNGPGSAMNGALTSFGDETGKLIAQYTGTGIVKTVNGVPASVTGNPSDFVRVDGTSGVGGDVAGPASSTSGALTSFNSETGKAIAQYTGTGIVKTVSGVPASVTGNPSDFVRVDGTSGLGGDVTGPASSTTGALTSFNSGTGKAIAQYTGTGIVKTVNGVPASVTGNPSDFIRVDGTSGVGGDVTGPASSTTGALTSFNSGTGKAIAQYTGTGIVKTVNGVPASVTGNPSDFVRVDGTSGVGGDVAGPASSTTGALTSFSGETGKAVAQYTGTGIVKTVNGVPASVTGNPSDFVRVDGTSGVGGDVAGPASSVSGALTSFSGTDGKSLQQYTGTGVLKASSGVPSVVTGGTSDCVRVDGTSAPCGNGFQALLWMPTAGAETITAGNGKFLPLGVSASTTSETRPFLVLRNGTISTLVFKTTGTNNTGAGTELVCSVWRNGANTSPSMEYRLAHGSAAGVYTSSTNPVSVVLGDTVSIRCENPGTATSAAISSAGIVLQY